jgi:hypothetical protein
MFLAIATFQRKRRRLLAFQTCHRCTSLLVSVTICSIPGKDLSIGTSARPWAQPRDKMMTALPPHNRKVKNRNPVQL